MSDPSAKADLRRLMRERLRAVPADELAQWSHRVVTRLQNCDETWTRPGAVALFGGLRNEPDLITELLPWLRARGWKTALFAMEGSGLLPYEVSGHHDLQRGPLGVWIPDVAQCRPMLPEELTVILVPGLAFTADGSRLGRGGGFYDRFLAIPSLSARRLGICFEIQVVPHIPCEDHDATVEKLITEQEVRSLPAP